MQEITLVLKKEAKDFSVNKNIWIRYLFVLVFNIVIGFADLYGLDELVGNKAAESLILLAATTYAVVGILCVNVIEKEKSHKTYETLLSTPLKLGNVFIGKAAFVFFFGFVFLLLGTAYNHLWLHFMHGQSYLDIAGSMAELLILYVLILLAVLAIAMLGMVASLFVTNYRMLRFAILFIGIASVVGVYQLMRHFTLELGLAIMLGVAGVVALVFLIIQKHMNKRYALKFAR